MNNYTPDPLEIACWEILQPLITLDRNELLRMGNQNAGEWGDQYVLMNIVSRVPQGQDVTLGFDENTGTYHYLGQRHGTINVTFVGDQASWRAEGLISRIRTESANDLCRKFKVAMFSPTTFNNIPFRDEIRNTLATVITIGYRVAYNYSDEVGVIEIVDLTSTVNEVTTEQKIQVITP